jgi:2-polyprenyl-6-hydroxyphenyl methylase/3-demethylubiquinone-9 3-methyltransferase
MTSTPRAYLEYHFQGAEPSHIHHYLMPHLFELAPPHGPDCRVLDVGCGNGFTCGAFARRGYQMVGVDLSLSGIESARKAFPECRFEVVSATADLLQQLDEPPFDLVISTEVVEHLYDPRSYARACYAALKPGGRFICSTPYHGYLKNLVISLLGRWDCHANPLWDCGHIKLWSRATLSRLLTDAGFANLKFRGAGRIPYLWMTMIMAADRPL